MKASISFYDIFFFICYRNVVDSHCDVRFVRTKNCKFIIMCTHDYDFFKTIIIT